MFAEKLRNIKWILIIVVAIIIGIFLGQFITSYETQYLLSREYCGNFRGIEVYRCGEINAENFVGHAHMLDDAPDALVESCTAMYFTGGELSVPIIGKENGKALGLTQETTVYIATDSFNVDVVYHELFHAYDNAHGKLSGRDEFKNIYYQEKDCVYVEVTDEESYPAEFFAAAGAAYLLEPEVLKEAAPLTYEYINNLIGEY